MDLKGVQASQEQALNVCFQLSSIGLTLFDIQPLSNILSNGLGINKNNG